MASSVAANGSNLSHVDQAVNNARGLRSRMDIDIQLGILRESQLALELSETTVRSSHTARYYCHIIAYLLFI